MRRAFQMKHAVDQKKTNECAKVLVEFFLPHLAPDDRGAEDELALIRVKGERKDICRVVLAAIRAVESSRFLLADERDGKRICGA